MDSGATQGATPAPESGLPHSDGTLHVDAIDGDWIKRGRTRPGDLHAHVGNGLVGYLSVELVDGRVRWRDERPGGEEGFLEPDADAWQRFYRELADCRVWEWASSYVDPGIVDGTYWGVTIVWGNDVVRSSGANAYPSEWTRFCGAVEELVGGRPFR